MLGISAEKGPPEAGVYLPENPDTPDSEHAQAEVQQRTQRKKKTHRNTNTLKDCIIHNAFDA